MNENRTEQLFSAIAAAVGITSIAISLNIKGFTAENFFDSLKDLSDLLVTLGVFVLALKIYRNQPYGNFKKKFEDELANWVDRNKYLIDSDRKHKGEKEIKSFYYMLTKQHHSNFVFRKQEAKEFSDSGGQLNPKGAFLYTDTKDKQEIIFGINKSFFLNKAGTDLPLGKTLTEIAEQFAERINEEFSDLKIKTSINNDGTRITVDLKEMEKTDDNAKKLIDMVEFVKTLIISLA